MFFFLFVGKILKRFIGAKFHQHYQKRHIMKFRISRKLKNIILSIIFAILTFLICLSNCPKIVWIGRYENISSFILEGYKICRVGRKNRVGRVSGNTGISF